TEIFVPLVNYRNGEISMSQFIVSARKYRPTRFVDVVGQQHVSQTLKNALQNDHLAHAFLFCGPRGVGKTTCARILAKVLNCQNVTEDHEPCNTCDSCVAFNNNASFNITELDAASNNSVEHIRALIEQVRFAPQQGKYKVFIIDEVHMLSTTAFNAFLKTLEEPPPYAVFILATTEKHKIIPTILSRCQIFDFKRIQVAAMVDHLESICREEGIDADQEALHVIAQKADGALRDSLSIFDRIVSFSGKQIRYKDVIENLNVLDYDYFFKMVDALLLQDVQQLLLIFDQILRNGFDPDIFLGGLAEHLRNLLVCKDESTLQLLAMSDQLGIRYREQAQLSPVSFLLNTMSLANECDIHYKTARNKRLHVEMYLIKMAYAANAVSGADLTLAPEKKKDISELKAAAPAPAPKPTPTPVITPPTAPEPPSQAAIPEPEVVPPAEPSPAAEEPSPADSQKPKVEQPEEQLPVAPAEEPVTKPMTASLSLEALDAEVADEVEVQVRKLEDVPLEEIAKAWASYADSITDDLLRGILRDTKVFVEDGVLIAMVATSYAKNEVLQEREMMEYLREELQVPDLQREIRVDETRKKKEAPPKKKLLTPKEKYIQMREQNPMVTEIRKRFDLSPDSDTK
ncbi:MAG: DNA polymerase III subunit gamma/tau, partial [Bacteroidota bacterium]